MFRSPRVFGRVAFRTLLSAGLLGMALPAQSASRPPLKRNVLQEIDLARPTYSTEVPAFKEIIFAQHWESTNGSWMEKLTIRYSDSDIVVVDNINRSYAAEYGVIQTKWPQAYTYSGMVEISTMDRVNIQNVRVTGNFPAEVGSSLYYEDKTMAGMGYAEKPKPVFMNVVSIAPSLSGFPTACPCSIVKSSGSTTIWSHALRWPVGRVFNGGGTRELLGYSSGQRMVGMNWAQAVRRAETDGRNAGALAAESQHRAAMGAVIAEGLAGIATSTMQQVTANNLAREAERQRQEEERQRVVAEQQAQSAAALAASNQALADSNRRLAEQQRAANQQQQSATQQQQSARLQTIGQQQMAARQTSSQSSSSSGGESRNTASYSFMGRSSMRLDQGYSVWDLSITNHTNRELQCRVQVQGSMYGVQNRGPGPYPRGLTNSIAQSNVFSPGETKRYSVVASTKGSWAVSGCTVFRALDRMPNVPLHRITVNN